MTSKLQHAHALTQTHESINATSHGRRIPAGAIYDLAPIGAVIRFRDGTPRPPRDRPEDQKVWALFNGIGRLTKKDPAPHLSPLPQPVSITLRTAEFGATPAAGVTISLAEPSHHKLSFEIVELPPVGSVRILRRLADNVELLHLAADHHSAVRWLAVNPVTTAIFDPVTADEVAAAAVEGRRFAP